MEKHDNGEGRDGKPNVFAPGDLTDGRTEGEWGSRYPDDKARKRIRREALYVFSLLALCPILMFVVWNGCAADWLRVLPGRQASFSRYALAWIGGLLGGSLITMKWLYHTVAHGYWNWDRVWWRLFTPHISGGLAFVLLAISQSTSALSSLNPARNASVVAVAALVGLFSDNALAKLAEVAETLFGPVRRRRWSKRRR